MNDKTIINTSEGLKDGQKICPNCGSTIIKYDIGSGKLKCDYCKTTFESQKINDDTNLRELTGSIIGEGAQNINNDFNNFITLKCNGCGAEVIINTENSTNAKCHWCGSLLSINSRIENGSVPDTILPFKIRKEIATQIIQNFISSEKSYANKQFLKNFKQEDIVGVYLPYLIVDLNGHSEFDGYGNHIIDKEYYEIDTRYFPHSYYKYKVETYHINCNFDFTIDDFILESNSKKIDITNSLISNDIIKSIMPFDTENCIQFNSNYLYGYNMEKRDINTNDLEQYVNNKVKKITKNAINDELGFFDGKIRWKKEKINIKGTKWIASYMPVWLYTYKKNKKSIDYIAVNGRTGKIDGSIPINKLKTFLSSCLVSIFIVAILICTIYSFHLNEIENFFSYFIYIIIIIYMLLVLVFYKKIAEQYRSGDKKHDYEKNIEPKIFNIIKNVKYIKTRKNLKTPFIDGANNENVLNSKEMTKDEKKLMKKLK